MVNGNYRQCNATAGQPRSAFPRLRKHTPCLLLNYFWGFLEGGQPVDDLRQSLNCKTALKITKTPPAAIATNR